MLKAEQRTAEGRAQAAQLERKRQEKGRAKAGKVGRKASVSALAAAGNHLQADDSSRSKRAKLQALWTRLSIVGGRGGKRGSAQNDRSVRDHRARLLEELRAEVEAYPGNLFQRAKAVRHELNDLVLLRLVLSLLAVSGKTHRRRRRKSSPLLQAQQTIWHGTSKWECLKSCAVCFAQTRPLFRAGSVLGWVWKHLLYDVATICRGLRSSGNVGISSPRHPFQIIRGNLEVYLSLHISPPPLHAS